MGKEEFLNSIKVDQSIIDNCNQVSFDYNARSENGQYTLGDNQQEIAHTTGFDRDGDFAEINEAENIGIEGTIDSEESIGIESSIDNCANSEIEGAIDNDMSDGIDGGIDM